MERMRKPFQGVSNIVRFNWPWFAASAAGLVIAVVTAPLFGPPLQWIIWLAAAGALAAMTVSLGISYYVYDRSSLYDLPWIDGLSIDRKDGAVIVNISAGFDETTPILRLKLPEATFHVWDFYDADLHTEASIKRARSAYPPDPQRVQVAADHLPMGDGSVDLISLIMSAHEIRKCSERRQFFEEVHRILQSNGTVCVTEHLRDLPNFLAYSLGFFHFHSRASWLSVFTDADFDVIEERKHTAFVSTFVLRKRAR